MQVSSIAELDTHVVIGGGAVQEFGLSNSPEFFTVLSDTLYSDKKRAVVREVLCNAWDAHIDCGKEDTPIQIDLCDEEMSIKDFGKGIAKDKIGPVYCIYGASTKVGSGSQTGGFGLGCKAPFAYSDHFTVTSCHDNIRTLWAISRGGVESDGKPSFREMVSVPTEETGITVTVPIASARDADDFEYIIRDVVKKGGMKATLNGELLETYDYTEARKTGFAIIPKDASTIGYPIHVLYGSVVYPVLPTDPKLRKLVADARDLIRCSETILLVAEPHSIGVVPSREALSYSELTNKTLADLLNNLIAKVGSEIKRIEASAINEHVTKIMNERRTLDPSRSITSDCLHKNTICIDGAVASTNAIARRACIAKIERPSNYIAIAKAAAKAIAKEGSRYSSLRRLNLHTVRSGRFRQEAGIFDLADAIGGAMFKADALRLNRLVLKTASQSELSLFKVGRKSKDDYVTPFHRKSLHAPLQRLVVIGPSRRAIFDAARLDVNKRNRTLPYDVGSGNFNSLFPCFIIRNKKSPKINEIKEQAENLGFDVMIADYPERRKPSGPKKKPVTLFHQASDMTRLTRGQRVRAGDPTLDQPDYYIEALGTSNSLDVSFSSAASGLNSEPSLYVLNALFPKTAIIWTSDQKKRIGKTGARNLADVLVEKIRKMYRNKDLQYEIVRNSEAGFLTKLPSYYERNADKVFWLAKRSQKVCRVLFPAKFRTHKSTRRDLNILDIAERLGVHHLSEDNKKVIKGLRKQARETFSDSIMSPKSANERFAYLAPISEFNRDERHEDAIIKVLKILKSSHKTSEKDAV